MRGINGESTNGTATIGDTSIYMTTSDETVEFDNEIHLEFPVLMEGAVALRGGVLQMSGDTAVIQLHLNLSYRWIDCTRASRYHLTITTPSKRTSIPCGLLDSLSTCHLDKMVLLTIQTGDSLIITLTKDAQKDNNDSLLIENSSYISIKKLI